MGKMYRNTVQGRVMLCSISELKKVDLYLGLGYHFFAVGNVGGTDRVVMIIYSNKQHNTNKMNIYFVQTRGTQNSKRKYYL